MTQWLIEEAAFAALDKAERAAAEGSSEERMLADRHAQMVALRDEMRAGV